MEKSELLGVKGVGPVTLEKLNYLGIYSRRGLIEKTPVDYIDLDAVSDLDKAEDGEFVVLVTEIVTAGRPFRKGIERHSASGVGERPGGSQDRD